jgi:beta-N-acetylhexosaminidase
MLRSWLNSGKKVLGKLKRKSRMVSIREDKRTMAGRMLMVGFEGLEVTAELREVIREIQPSGVILFKRNVTSPEQVYELTREIKMLSSAHPLMVSVDQEGGHVARIRHPATEWPAMESLGRLDDLRLTYQIGEGIGRELRAMNIDIDFAPVVDVNTNPDNPVIGSRAFSDRSDVVARHGVALYKGLEEGDVGACLKHFPGHGDTDLDSHFDLPMVHHPLERLKSIDWPPFKASIDAGVGAVMSAHVLVEILDPTLPGTLSSRTLGILRDELRFKGVIVSDDVEMKALSERYTIDEIALKGCQAGLDIFLACHRPEVQFALYRSLVVGLENKSLDDNEMKESHRRVENWQRKWHREPSAKDDLKRWVGCGEHSRLCAEVEERLLNTA